MDFNNYRLWVATVLALAFVISGCGVTSRAQCEEHQDCDELEICQDGYCAQVECTKHDDCDEGSSCRRGYCTAHECEEHEDCEEDERCVAGLCQQVDCEPECEEGFECRHGSCWCLTDEACEDWEICDEGNCVPDPEAECSPTLQCDDGMQCIEARCYCERDRVCDEGERCEDAECVEATPCETDDDCADDGHICDWGYCLEPCISSAECGSPSHEYACLEDRCWERCFLGDEDCDIGFICEEVTQNNLVCQPAECETLEDCGDDNKICTSADHGRCIEVVYCDDDDGCDWTEACRTPDPCPPGFDCENDKVCEARDRCRSDDDCTSDEVLGYCDQGYCFDSEACEDRDDCEDGLDCVGGGCVPWVCRGPSDCEPGEVCSGGECIEPQDRTVDRVTLLSPGGFILPGEERQLRALAYDNHGRAIEGALFDWSSDDEDVITVDQDGWIKGVTPSIIDPGNGGVPGPGSVEVANITAEAGGESDSVDWHLLPEIVANTLRVIVVDAETGTPADDVVVTVSGGLEASTDDFGIAEFTVTDDSPIDIHVFDGSGEYDYLSVFDTEERDILIPLSARSDPDMVAGVRGTISHEHVTSEGDLAIGMAGVSIGGTLQDFDMERLMGRMFTVEIPGMDFSIPLPGSMTARGRAYGMEFDLKDEYIAFGEEGLRMGWAFAGRMPLDDMMGGGGGMGIANILPMFSMFEHGLAPRIRLEGMELGDQIDDGTNGDPPLWPPSWLIHFPAEHHQPAQSQNLRLKIEPESLSSPMENIVVLAGGRAPRIGLVPLGLSGSEGDTIRMRMTPAYGGLEISKYQIVTMASPEVGDMEVPTEVSARIHTSSDLPGTVELEAFMPLPDGVTWTKDPLAIHAVSTSRAHMLRVVIEGADRAWHVYAPNPGGGTVDLELPAAPEGLDDLDQPGKARINAIELTSPFVFDDLLHVGGWNIMDLDDITAAYSRVEK